ncbi:MAG: hypothetical protein HN389_11765 [Clostridia bacterium]|jgi:hypothetical protein|nr:hypothetical protein [Clostridia bacterium]
MKRVGIKKRELEKYRNLYNANRFIEGVFSQIKENYTKERIPYRLSKGNYKYFSEEYIPIYRYLKYVYGFQSHILFKHVGIGNQPYDGVVKIGELYKRIEVSYLYLGKYANDQQKKLIEDGAAYSYRDAGELFSQIKKVILDTARKKAKKPYGDTLLVLYYASGEDLYPGETGMEQEKFAEIIEELQRIKYHAKRVDFFIPQIKYENEDGKQVKTSKLYRIK